MAGDSGRRIAAVVLAWGALAAFPASVARGVTLDTSGTGPEKIEIKCQNLTSATVKKATFTESTSIYTISGICMTMLHFKDAPPLPAPGPLFDITGTWSPQSMIASESITVHQHIAPNGTLVTKDVYLKTMATCTSDPWANASPGCQKGTASEGSGTPPGTLQQFIGKFGQNYPVSRFLIPSATIKKHHDELMRKPPALKLPVANQKFSKGKVLAQVYLPYLPFLADSLDTWSVVFEFTSAGSGPAAKVVNYSKIAGQYSILGKALAAGKWQVRAKSKSPKHDGAWSPTVPFEIAGQP